MRVLHILVLCTMFSVNREQTRHERKMKFNLLELAMIMEYPNKHFDDEMKKKGKLAYNKYSAHKKGGGWFKKMPQTACSSLSAISSKLEYWGRTTKSQCRTRQVQNKMKVYITQFKWSTSGASRD